jgi:sortase A
VSPQAPTLAHRPSRVWSAVGVVGELLITLGALLLLFVAYQLWWTNVVSARESQAVASDLRQHWEQPEPQQTTTSPAPPQSDFTQAFAFMYIPRLKDKVWALPILGSVTLNDLARGLGHYPESAKPGEKGNFAVAGHRATHGEPLRDIPQVRAGDDVYVETRDVWYVYRLTTTKIVKPNETWVVDPVPGHPGAKPTNRLITLTTCNPRWASYERWIWWGEQIDKIDKSTGDVPDAIAEGG